jgi:starch phosphorylase
MTTKAESRVRAKTDVLARVRALAMNLWWTWHLDAQRLFAVLDPRLWEAAHHNPILALEHLSRERRSAVRADARFLEHLDHCERALQEYLATRTWFDRTYRSRKGATKPLVAYFCAEFAIHESLPQYSGGLGVLAGDHVKSASDLGVPLVGVGLLYRAGYYTQQFNADGTTRVIYPQIDFADLPIEDTGRTIDVPIAARKVRAKIWRQMVGRVAIYLLDTDVAPNRPKDRALTRHLYGGDREYRIQQEILLGIGGVMALDAIGARATVFHLNEGHAAFCALERLRRLRVAGTELARAIDLVRDSTVFTTHTPVPAGHDRFDLKMLRKYLPQMRQIADVWYALGQEAPPKRDSYMKKGSGPFNEKGPDPFLRGGAAGHDAEVVMTVFALNLSAHRNGVAKLHGQVSREMWQHLFDVRSADDVPIGSITNGIHSETWLAPEIRPLYDKYLKPKWLGAGPRDDWWRNASRIPPAELWNARRMLRARMIRFIRQRLVEQILRRHGSVEEIAAANVAFDEDALTIGFARRFATYKRAPLIFRDASRLARILNDAKRPVQIVFAGKAHPKDLGGQEFAQEIFARAGEPRFSGRVLILEDYDMELGRMLTSGCDVWLNNPLRPQEASGTSGMKPPLHGGINFSVLDGWWPEAFNGRNGWAINGPQFAKQSRQDKHDAEQIYKLLEREIVPEFYARDRRGLPTRWIARMTESMRTVCGDFNTHRMVGEYWTKYYDKAHASSRQRTLIGRL